MMIPSISLPPSRLPGDGFEFCHSYHHVDQTGGDFTDVRLRGDGRAVLIIADVSGHGPSAARASEMAKLSFARVADTARQPGEILTAMNGELAPRVEPGRFMTAIAAVFDPAQRTVELAVAGHPRPFLLRGGEAKLVHLESDWPLLVAGEKIYSASSTLQLQAGDRLLFYTDGATDVINREGMFLDAGGLGKILAQAAALRGAALLERLYAAIRTYAEGDLRDDVAFVCLEVAEGSPSC